MEKLSQLIVRLLDRTEMGLVAWRPTADDDTFQFSLPDSSVLIEWNGQARYYVSVLNGDGQLVDRASDEQLDASGRILSSRHNHEQMKKLHDLARRKALKAEETLDGILAKLAD